MTGKTQPEGVITFIRWSLVATYTLLAFQLTHDGTSVGDLRGLAVTGMIFIVIIVLSPWINAAGGRDD